MSEYVSELSEFHRGKSWVSEYVRIQRSYETPRQGRTSPAGTHRHVEGWGLMLLWGDCLCPRDVAAVGSWCCCGMGVMRQNWWKLAVLDTKKSSPMDSVSMLRKRVHWTRFLPTFFREPTQLLANNKIKN